MLKTDISRRIFHSFWRLNEWDYLTLITSLKIINWERYLLEAKKSPIHEESGHAIRVWSSDCQCSITQFQGNTMETGSSYLKKLTEQEKVAAAFKVMTNGVSLFEYRLLRIVVDGPKRLKNIAQLRGVSPQGMGKIYRRLASEGLLTVEVDPRDKRARLVTLNQEGHDMIDYCEGQLEDLLDLEEAV